MEPTNHSIHCKVNYNNLIRRFSFIGTEFTSLKETIAQLYSINHEFVLIYLDDENDQILLISQEDFITALQITPQILRIFIMGSAEETPDSGKSPVSFSPASPISKQRKVRLERKLNFVNQRLRDFGLIDSNLTQRQFLRKQRLLKQQERTIACLNGNCPRKQRAALSPETVLFVHQQKCLIKAEICLVKARMRELKMLLQDQKDQKLKDELTELKERKNVLRAQRRSLN